MTMQTNITLNIGNISLIKKLDAEYNCFNLIFSDVYKKAKNFIPGIKLLISNRLDECIAISRLKDLYSEEAFFQLDFLSIPSERDLYRDIERIGLKFPFFHQRFQELLLNEKLNAQTQNLDFTSSYFEGSGGSLGEYGYSRDGQPNKKQLTIGVSTGINGIPSAITIQKGNVQDKKHFQVLVKAAGVVLEEKSLLVFDCGGNTKNNKLLVRNKNFHYLTLKPKKISPYKSAIEVFNRSEKKEITINGMTYQSVKNKKENEIEYIYFSEKHKNEQLTNKDRKFQKEIKKNKSVLKKTEDGKEIDQYLTEKGYVTTIGTLQETLQTLDNPFVKGIEGFFILESSLDVEPEKILALYKDKDKAEKFFRSMKEGAELRPMRHWSDNAILGYIFIVFLTNFLINLTLLKTKDIEVKNTKLLKKYLKKLTLVVIYEENGQKRLVLANVSEQLSKILGDFIEKCIQKPPNLVEVQQKIP